MSCHRDLGETILGGGTCADGWHSGGKGTLLGCGTSEKGGRGVTKEHRRRKLPLGRLSEPRASDLKFLRVRAKVCNTRGRGEVIIGWHLHLVYSGKITESSELHKNRSSYDGVKLCERFKDRRRPCRAGNTPGDLYKVSETRSTDRREGKNKVLCQRTV